jgi:hypothetical protein
MITHFNNKVLRDELQPLRLLLNHLNPQFLQIRNRAGMFDSAVVVRASWATITFLNIARLGYHPPTDPCHHRVPVQLLPSLVQTHSTLSRPSNPFQLSVQMERTSVATVPLCLLTENTLSSHVPTLPTIACPTCGQSQWTKARPSWKEHHRMDWMECETNM